MALLVTSPLMSPGSYTMLSGMLGFGWANVVLICAVSLGLFACYVTLYLRSYGFSEQLIFRRRLPAGNFHDADYPVEELRCECGKQLSHRVEACNHNPALVFLAKAWEGGLKIGKFALIGLAIEVLAATFIPNAWVSNLLSGEGVRPILVLTFATIPLHLPQITAASMIFGFFDPAPGQAVALARGPGVAMLVGGPVTALPVMGVFLSMFQKRVVLLYLGLCVSGTLLLAFGYRWLPVTF
jgi:uncharacterized membrane protein YraQ (UPF0718 family)